MMGVSISYRTVTRRREQRTVITPGWRSMMHNLLLKNGLYGGLDKHDVPLLLKMGRTQLKGQKDPPFDYAEDIRLAFHKIVRAIRRHGYVTVEYDF